MCIVINKTNKKPAGNNVSGFSLNEIPNLMKGMKGKQKKAFLLFEDNLYEAKEVDESLMFFVIDKAKKKPDESKFWDYPLDEVPYLMEGIEDGDRDDGCKFLLFGDRLFETEKTAQW